MSVTIINRTNIPAVPIDEGHAIHIHVSYNSIKARLSITFNNTSLAEAIRILRCAHDALVNNQHHQYVDNNNSILIVDDTTKA
jgi:hypothetical protein